MDGLKHLFGDNLSFWYTCKLSFFRTEMEPREWCRLKWGVKGPLSPRHRQRYAVVISFICTTFTVVHLAVLLTPVPSGGLLMKPTMALICDLRCYKWYPPNIIAFRTYDCLSVCLTVCQRWAAAFCTDCSRRKQNFCKLVKSNWSQLVIIVLSQPDHVRLRRCAGSELTSSIMDDRPHIFHNLSLSSWFIAPVRDYVTGTCRPMWTLSLASLTGSARLTAGNESRNLLIASPTP